MRAKRIRIHYISGGRLDKFPARVGPSRGFLSRAEPDEIVQAREDSCCPRCENAMDISGVAGLCWVCGFRF